MNAGAMHWWMGLIGTGGVTAATSTCRPAVSPTINGWNANTFHQEIGERPRRGQRPGVGLRQQHRDSHPMHLHLVQFQVLHRRKAGAVAAGVAEGALVNAWEKGWKDTVAVHPGQITRVRAKFELPTVPDPAVVTLPVPAGFTSAGTSPHYDLQPGQAERCFVYHCHILEHEENDMMRPFLVT